MIDPVAGGYEFNAPEGETFRVQIAGTDEVQRANQVIIFDDQPVVGRPQPVAKRKVSTPSSSGPAEESRAVTDYYSSLWEGFESYGVGVGEHVGAIASGVRDAYYDVTTHHEGIAVGAWIKAKAVGAAVWWDAESVVFDGYGGTFAALSEGDFSGAAGSYGQGAGAAWRLAGLAVGASGTGAAIGNWGRRLIRPRSVAPSGGAGATSAAGGGGPKALQPAPVTSTSDFISARSIMDLRSRIPSHAKQVPWKDVAGGAESGIKWKWTDGAGNKWEVRAHSLDPSAPAGSNAGTNWVYRVEVNPKNVGGRWHMDSAGNLHKRNLTNENSPLFDPNIANDTHIPFRR